MAHSMNESNELVDELQALKSDVAAKLVAYSDFPKPGILFQDIMPLFADMQLVEKLCAAAADNARKITKEPITHVVGLEARGFLFGPSIAARLGVPFVPVRKPGKLPGAVVRATYEKEYGQDVIEMQSGALSAGARVMIVDDLLATGGTLAGVMELLHSLPDVRAVHVFCVVELVALHARAKLPADLSISCLLQM